MAEPCKEDGGLWKDTLPREEGIKSLAEILV